jgi:dTDP-4-dehydrorhamnose reductase
MKILVTGKNGQLGKSIYKLVVSKPSSHKFIFVGRKELDFFNIDSFEGFFNQNIFDIVINCAAYTAVDRAEDEPDLANIVNNLAVKKIAEIAKKRQFKLIHISTDYVFDGETSEPYIYSDITNPINVYGRSKLAGELAIKKILPNDALIIRTSGLYSEFGNNFVKTILRLGKVKEELNIVFDQIVSPTYASDLAEAILKIIDSEKFKILNQKTQIYHYCSSNSTSWYDFASEVFKLSETSVITNPIKLSEYPTLVKKPIYSVLSIKKISSDFNVETFDWQTSLKRCLN